MHIDHVTPRKFQYMYINKLQINFYPPSYKVPL